MNDNNILAYAILARELQRLNDKSMAEGLAGADLKTLEVIIKSYKLLDDKPLDDKTEQKEESKKLTDKQLLKLLEDDE